MVIQPKLISIKDACTRLGISRSTFYQHFASSDLLMKTIGGARRVDVDVLEEIIIALPSRRMRGRHNYGPLRPFTKTPSR